MSRPHSAKGRRITETEVFVTRSGLHHVRFEPEKRLVCGRRLPMAELVDVKETEDDLRRMIEEPANERYLCLRCRALTALALSPKTKDTKP